TGAVVAGGAARIRNAGAVHHGVRRDARVEVGGVGAEGAVLAAIAELGGQDAAKGDAVAVEVAAHLVGGVEEVVDRLALHGEQLARLVAGHISAGNDPASQGEGVERLGGGHEGPPEMSFASSCGWACRRW